MPITSQMYNLWQWLLRAQKLEKWVFATQVVLRRQTYANHSELSPDHKIYNRKKRNFKNVWEVKYSTTQKYLLASFYKKRLDGCQYPWKLQSLVRPAQWGSLVTWAGHACGAEHGLQVSRSLNEVGCVGERVYQPELRNILSARLNNMKGAAAYFIYEIESK